MEKEENKSIEEEKKISEESPAEESLAEEEEENTKEEKQEKEEEKPFHIRAIRFGIELVLYLTIILFGAVAIPKYVIQRTLVDGKSMENNLQNKDNLLVEKVSRHFKNLDRFDVIVFYPYYDKETSETSFWYDLRITCMNILHMDTSKYQDSKSKSKEYFVKRIIGLPGETIQIIGDEIYIDGELLEEDYGKMPITNGGIAEEPLTLADDEYFVLGDNRKISYDSRYEEVGPVQKEEIAGRAILRIWPFDSFGTIK